MAASTASICLRKESLSVHSQSNFQDSSRFNQYLLRLVQHGSYCTVQQATDADGRNRVKPSSSSIELPTYVTVLSSSVQPAVTGAGRKIYADELREPTLLPSAPAPAEAPRRAWAR